MSIIKVETDLYSVSYNDVVFVNPSTPDTEIIRYRLFQEMVEDFAKLLGKRNPKKRNRTTKEQITLILCSYIYRTSSMIDYSKPVEDGLFKLTSEELEEENSSNEYITKQLQNTFTGDNMQAISRIFNIRKRFREASKNIGQKIPQSGFAGNNQEDMKTPYTILRKEKRTIYVSEGIKELEISNELYERLQEKMINYIQTTTLETQDLQSVNYDVPPLDDLVFMLLLRYKFLGESNNQSGMPRKIKNLFHEKMDVDFECMSSALNHHFSRYCSLFYDIEKYFMSCGPISNTYFHRGVFMSNPPYEEDLLSSMVDIFISSMDDVNEVSREPVTKLCFIFGLPKWVEPPELEFYTMMRKLDSSMNKFYPTIGIEFSGKWENLVTGNIFSLPMVSYRCMIGNTGHGTQDLWTTDKDTITYEDIVRTWKEL